MYVLTIDQRGSTADVDRVPDLITALRSLASAPFERSVGDELQGVVEHAEDVVEIAMYALRSGHWYVGIGVVPCSSPRVAAPGKVPGAALWQRERPWNSPRVRLVRCHCRWCPAVSAVAGRCLPAPRKEQ